MNDHIPELTKMISDTPRTDAHNWHDGDYDDPLHAFYDFARILERELNAANVEMDEKRKDVVWLATEKAKLEERIKRLEETLDKTTKIASQRIKRLEEAGDAMTNCIACGCNDGGCTTCRGYEDKWVKAKEAKP